MYITVDTYITYVLIMYTYICVLDRYMYISCEFVSFFLSLSISPYLSLSLSMSLSLSLSLAHSLSSLRFPLFFSFSLSLYLSRSLSLSLHICIGGMGAETNREIVSLRSCMRAQLYVRSEWILKFICIPFPFSRRDFCPFSLGDQVFPFPLDR